MSIRGTQAIGEIPGWARKSSAPRWLRSDDRPTRQPGGRVQYMAITVSKKSGAVHPEASRPGPKGIRNIRTAPRLEESTLKCYSGWTT